MYSIPKPLITNFDFFPQIPSFCKLSQPQVSVPFSKTEMGFVNQSFNENQTMNCDPKQVTINLNSTEIERKSNYLSDLFVKRKQNIARHCNFKKTHTKEVLTNDPSNLMVLKDRNLAFCPVFKAGSSTWLTILLDLSSITEVRIIFLRATIKFF